mmetsp:Transcript_24088/g.26761  ORF Transcript_24088/g.26761 Transcript_24088/m.26761 type:complete len:149 (-) Transcript_24088:29-475(-)
MVIKRNSLEEQRKLISELKKQRFTTEILKSALERKKITKNRNEESQQAVNEFHERYYSKLQTYIDIYNELESNKFEDLIIEEGTLSQEGSTIFKRKDSDEFSSDMNKELKNISLELEGLIKLKSSPSHTFTNPAQGIDHYANIWEAKY